MCTCIYPSCHNHHCLLCGYSLSQRLSHMFVYAFHLSHTLPLDLSHIISNLLYIGLHIFLCWYMSCWCVLAMLCSQEGLLHSVVLCLLYPSALLSVCCFYCCLVCFSFILLWSNGYYTKFPFCIVSLRLMLLCNQYHSVIFILYIN